VRYPLACRGEIIHKGRPECKWSRLWGPRAGIFVETQTKTPPSKHRRESVREKARRLDLFAVHPHRSRCPALVRVRPAVERRPSHVFVGSDTGLRAEPIDPAARSVADPQGRSGARGVRGARHSGFGRAPRPHPPCLGPGAGSDTEPGGPDRRGDEASKQGAGAALRWGADRYHRPGDTRGVRAGQRAFCRAGPERRFGFHRRGLRRLRHDTQPRPHAHHLRIYFA
jgi:hypothetical protein